MAAIVAAMRAEFAQRGCILRDRGNWYALAPFVRMTLRAAVHALLLASGATALVYEVVWARLLGLVMGSTAYALSAILSSFLGGLALGAWLAGRWTRTHRTSLRHYALVEALVAVLGALMPWLIGACAPLFGVAYRSLAGAPILYNLVQFAVCGAILLLPAVLMGTTLPLVSAVLVRTGAGVGARAGRLYAVNTIGGALGVAACGFLLLPELGMRATGFLAAGVNLAIALVAAALTTRVDRAEERAELASSSKVLASSQAERADPGAERATAELARAAEPGQPSAGAREPAPEPARAARATNRDPSAPAQDWPAPSPRALVALYGVAGFAALALEVGWVRLVSLSIGSTTAGFTTTLLSFIAGLALGGYGATRVPAILRRPVASIVWLNVTIAVWSLVSLPWLGTLPVRVAELIGDVGADWSAVLRGEVLLVASTILVPTLAMGAMFPLAVELVARPQGAAASAGSAVGLAYAANTWGNILGSFVGGFVLVPAIGMRGTIVVSALASASVAAAFLVPAWRTRPSAVLVRVGGIAALVAAAFALAPAWDRGLITSGAYVNAQVIAHSGARDLPREAVEQVLLSDHDELVDYREGATAVVAVKRKGGQLRLNVGGYTEAASQAQIQDLLAHLPLLLHARARDVLVVGLGSGATVGSVLRHPVARADVVEISPEVAEVARLHFARFTGAPLDDPRVRLVIADGRNHLRHSGERYDAIISQPSVPWFSGAAGMFTYECFADMRAALEPGGVAVIWYVSWTAESRDLRSLLRTWTEVFPAAYLFETRAERTFLLVGFEDDGAQLEAADVRTGLARIEVGQEMAGLGYGDVADVLGHAILGGEDLRAYAAGAPRNDDDGAFIEFASPAGMLGRERADQLRELATFARVRVPAARYVDQDGLAPSERAALVERLGRIDRAKELVAEARTLGELGSADPARWQALVREAAELNPRDPYVLSVRPRSSRAPAR